MHSNSNLRQHITSLVKDIFPLGGPLRRRADDRGRAHSVPQCSSQETNTNISHRLKHLNPLPQCTPPHKSSVLEKRTAVDFSSGSKKTFVGDQKSLTNYSTSVRKVQFRNNNNDHSNNERLCLSAGRKVAPLQRQHSFEKQKEFADALFKQLNENLKVGRPVVQMGTSLCKMPSASRSSFPSDSLQAAAPPNSQRRQSLDYSEIYQSQSSEKMDKPFIRDHSSSLFSREEHMDHHATTPGGKSLSLKRPRDSSAERLKEGKRLCHEEIECTSSSTRGSSSTFTSSSKSIKRAFIKRLDESVLTLKEKCSPESNKYTVDRIKTINNLDNHHILQEPKTENHKPQAATLSIMGNGTGHQKDERRRSSESKCTITYVTSTTADPCASPSSKPPQILGEGGSTVSSHAGIQLGCMSRAEFSSLEQQPNLTSPRSMNVTDSHNSKTSPRVKGDVEKKKDLVWQDPIDLDFGEDNGLESCILSLSSSQSSEEDHLLSLNEILAHSTRVPSTPDNVTFSEPSTPGPKYAPEDFRYKTTSYKNTLEQMLKEKEHNQKAKEMEAELLQACKEDLLKLDEDHENAEEELSHEQREFLQRYSITSCIIRDLHPGEEVFILAKSGRLFNHQSLDLRKLGVIPNNRAQQTLLQAHSEQFLPLLSAGLFRRAYLSSPCQPLVSRWLFQMMSVHPNPIVCAQILQTLTTIALCAAQQIVENSNMKFKVWVPGMQDVALVFLNMGASFVSLFPSEDLQPTFTEGDLLESFDIQPDGTRSEKEADPFPEHNLENIIKYLALCAALCPKAYSDEELLLMLTVVCRVSLETRVQLLPTGDISCLLQHLLNNMTDWEMQLSQVCQVITNLSEDHHNLRRLVQLLPHSGRGRQLRKHVSVSIISKLLNHRCTYTPSGTEFQLSNLRCYLPRMRPTLLLKGLIAAKTTDPQETSCCATTPDQQAYYLCYSLLALTNEASNFEFLPSNQRNELLLLSAELEKHVKCDIRESEKMLYRSKVKDLVARIYTKWQVLVQRSRAQEGKLYERWRPLPEQEMRTEGESQFTEQEDTAESMSDEPGMVQSEIESMEENEELPVDSDGQLDSIDEKMQEEIEQFKKVLADVKDEQKEAEVTKDLAMDEELLGNSSNGSLENEEDTDLTKWADELLNDESLGRNEDFVKEENDKNENLALLKNYVDIFEKTKKLLLDS